MTAADPEAAPILHEAIRNLNQAAQELEAVGLFFASPEARLAAVTARATIATGQAQLATALILRDAAQADSEVS